MHVRDTRSFSAISRVVLWRSESIIALIRLWNPQLLSCQPNNISEVIGKGERFPRSSSSWLASSFELYCERESKTGGKEIRVIVNLSSKTKRKRSRGEKREREWNGWNRFDPYDGARNETFRFKVRLPSYRRKTCIKTFRRVTAKIFTVTFQIPLRTPFEA